MEPGAGSVANDALADQAREGGVTPTPALQISRVSGAAMYRVAREYVNAHHSYIQWSDRPSRKLYWVLCEGEGVVGVWGLSSAYIRPKSVSAFMLAHALSFNEMANNVVYCLGPHMTRHAGSRFLALLRRDAVKWWLERYGDTLRCFQTFIKPPWRGSVYRADNWCLVGQTRGVAQSVRTIRAEEASSHPRARRRVFKSGEVRFTVQDFVPTESKLVFLRLA